MWQESLPPSPSLSPMQMNHPMQVKPATNEPRTTPVGKGKEFCLCLCPNYHLSQHWLMWGGGGGGTWGRRRREGREGSARWEVKREVRASVCVSSAEERRLFVGMLSRDLTEEDVRHMFSQFGHVEDVSILRNAQGTSKGESRP